MLNNQTYDNQFIVEDVDTIELRVYGVEETQTTYIYESESESNEALTIPDYGTDDNPALTIGIIVASVVLLIIVVVILVILVVK